MLSNKGLEFSYWILVEAVVISLAMVFMFQYISGISDDTLIEEQMLARDLALMANTANSIKGELEFEYQSDANLSRYAYAFAEAATVRKPGEEVSASYPLYVDSHISNSLGVITRPDSIFFFKSRNSFSITDDLHEQSGCPDTRTSLELVQIDSDDASYEVIEDILRRGSGFAVQSTRSESSTYADRLKAANPQADAIVSVRKGSPLIMKANEGLETEKLACIMQKNLPQEAAITRSDDGIIAQADAGIIVQSNMDAAHLSAVIMMSLREYDE
jgi:hypothetical protein